MGSSIGPNRVIAEDVENCTYSVAMLDARHYRIGRGNAYSITTLIRLPDKGRAINRLVV